MSDTALAGDIRDVDFADALGERYLSYALSTIMARSLPDVTVIPRAPELYAGPVAAHEGLWCLGRHLRTNRDRFPRREGGYLVPDAARSDPFDVGAMPHHRCGRRDPLRVRLRILSGPGLRRWLLCGYRRETVPSAPSVRRGSARSCGLAAVSRDRAARGFRASDRGASGEWCKPVRDARRTMRRDDNELLDARRRADGHALRKP